MSRAVVSIGVNRTGGLPQLKDAANSAKRIADWAEAQGVEHIRVLSDDGGSPVFVHEIKTAIRELADEGTVEQLVIYFAGHGINVNRGERWLLSDAPADPQAAVNVPGSAELARWGRIPYVVFFSDACRTAAQGIQAQGVTGSEIFPNEDVAELELPVDQFFACRLGRPAHEIPDSATTSKEYKGIYTEALVAVLNGHDPEVIDAQGYVRPRPLKRFLQRELARRLRTMKLQTKLIQVPDAHIASDETAWISRVSPEPPPAAAPAPAPPAPEPPLDELGPTTKTVLDRMLDPLLRDTVDGFHHQLQGDLGSDEPGVVELAQTVARTAEPFETTHFETGCGFKVRGARVVDVVAVPILQAERLGDALVRIYPAGPSGGSVLLVLEGGRGIALPAIPGFLGTVTVEDGQVVDVGYEPSDNGPRWADFQERAREVRALRAVVASASREGTFSLEGDDALEVARRMQYAKSIDPSLAVYAAYAYADQGRRDLIREMRTFMTDDLGGALFDVALLARERGFVPPLLGFAPLLAQGWALLAAARLPVPDWLPDLQRNLVPDSLWTLYDELGAQRVRQAIVGGEVL